MSFLALIADILFIGHSLVGPDLPPLVAAGMAAQGQEVTVAAQIINGAPLAYQWDHAADAEGVDGRVALAAGVQAVVLTEAVPLAGHIQWNDTPGRIAAFGGLAREGNPEVRIYLYETWHSLKSGPGAVVADDPGAGVPWRERIAADVAVWQGVAAQAAAQMALPVDSVQIIPAGQAMGLAADAIAAGEVPGIAAIGDLFVDDIHPNGKGLYLVAMVHVATLTGKSPEGLPAKLTRFLATRDAMLTDAQAAAFQRIAWAAVQGQTGRRAAAAVPADAVVPVPGGVTNPRLALGLAGIADWSPQLPFLDLMKSARPWTGHLPGQWGGWDHAELAKGGWLDGDGWPVAIPPDLTGISTLILTDLPQEAAGAAGGYVLRHLGRGDITVEGPVSNVVQGAGVVTFDYAPGPGGVVITLKATDPADPIRAMTVVRADRVAAFDSGALFNPDWLDRIRGVKAVRFMDWMATNDSALARLDDRPKISDYTWGRHGVPVEVLIALANELNADPWFTMPHLAQDDLVQFYASAARDGLKPGLVASVEYSNEVWNWQFAQARWAEEQGIARWGQDQTWVQYYALRAAQVADIWASVYGDQAQGRLQRVIATQTGYLGLEAQILDGALLQAEGLDVASHFDAYAVTGYFAALLGSDEKRDVVKGWLAESRDGAKSAATRFDRAIDMAAQELRDGSVTGAQADSLAHLVAEVWPYQAKIAKDHGLRLVMYEGGTHVVGYGVQVDDVELTAFFQQLNYAPQMAALYGSAMAEWARISDAPFNAFVDVATPTKWGSWGALRHLGDDNPRWRAIAAGCAPC